MAVLDLATIMEAIATAISTADVATNVYGWPTESANPPCAIVGYPEQLEFDKTFNRGMDRAVFPVWFVVGKVADKTARDALSVILADSSSVKSAIEGASIGSSAWVKSANIETFTMNGVAYLAARFDVDVMS